MYKLFRRHVKRSAEHEVAGADRVHVLASKQLETVRVTMRSGDNYFTLGMSRDEARELAARLDAAVERSDNTIGWINQE